MRARLAPRGAWACYGRIVQKVGVRAVERDVSVPITLTVATGRAGLRRQRTGAVGAHATGGTGGPGTCAGSGGGAGYSNLARGGQRGRERVAGGWSTGAVKCEAAQETKSAHWSDERKCRRCCWIR